MTPTKPDNPKHRDPQAPQGEKANPQEQGAGRNAGQQRPAKTGERPIADVDRKVRGGDA